MSAIMQRRTELTSKERRAGKVYSKIRVMSGTLALPSNVAEQCCAIACRAFEQNMRNISDDAAICAMLHAACRIERAPREYGFFAARALVSTVDIKRFERKLTASVPEHGQIPQVRADQIIERFCTALDLPYRVAALAMCMSRLPRVVAVFEGCKRQTVAAVCIARAAMCVGQFVSVERVAAVCGIGLNTVSSALQNKLPPDSADEAQKVVGTMQQQQHNAQQIAQ